ncbi:MAG: lytic murein transglycosylase, partial [Cellvibrio sp.]|nr:lytic murein transglycosylase [Cellvibrio sp.]
MRFSKILWPIVMSASVFVGSITLTCAQAATKPATKTVAAKPDPRQIERQIYNQAQKALN